MIRESIKKQLEACTFADLTNFDQNTNTYYIPKYNKPIYELNKCYLIKIPNCLIADTTSVLATNWNKNTAPQAEYIKAFVSKILGKMIYVDCVAYDFETKQDTNLYWSGWLPINEITQVAYIG